MEDIYFSVNLQDGHTLCLAPLTDRRIAMSGQEIPDTGGYFLYEQKGRGEHADIEVIAHILSEDAVMRIKHAFNMD